MSSLWSKDKKLGNGVLYLCFVAMVGCGDVKLDDIIGGCNAEPRPGLNVQVMPVASLIGKTGFLPLDPPEITIIDEDSGQDMRSHDLKFGSKAEQGSDGVWTYLGAWEQPGTYTVEVQYGGFSDIQKHVSVTRGRCHPQTKTLQMNVLGDY